MIRGNRKKSSSFEFKQFSSKQLKVLNWWRDGSPYKECDMIITDGSIRAGKTIAMIVSFFQWSLTNFKGKDFIIAGRTMGSLKRNVIKPSLQILTAWGLEWQYNRSENFLVVGTNTYYFFGASTEASQDVVQGMTAAGMLGDEAALFPKSFLEQAIGRCSIEGSKVFLNCNPLTPFHYFKLEFIDKAGERHIYHLHFTMDDNLTLSDRVKERYKRQFTGVFFKRYILGLWVMAEGLIYDMFNEETHVVKTENRRYSKYYVSVDYGTLNPTAFGLWGLHNDIWYKVKEYHYSGRDNQRQKTDSEFADDMVEFCKGISVTEIIVDPSASSFKAELRKRGLKTRNGDNNVVDGIRFTSSCLSNNKIKINDVCRETIKEFFSYSWDAKASDRGEDKPVKEHDHHMDETRYFCNTVIRGKGKAGFKFGR